MDENLKFGFTLAAGAVGGAVIAGVFALVGAWVANIREHRQWLRNERLRAYETYFADTRPWAVERWIFSDIDASKEAETAKLQLQLVAPKEVVDAGFRLAQQISDYRTVFESHQVKGQPAVVDTELFGHHIAVIGQRSAELGHAMRKSLKLSRRESKHWVSLIQDDSPSEEEYRAGIKS